MYLLVVQPTVIPIPSAGGATLGPFHAASLTQALNTTDRIDPLSAAEA